MCAHIGQNRYIYPPSIFCLHFWLEAPSPFCAGWRWGLLSRKIFFDFFSESIINSFWLYFDSIFFIFSESFNSIRVPRYFSWVSFFCLSNIINYRFDSHTSFTQYLLVCDSWLRFWFSTRINFDLFQHCLFYALTLQLFISLTLLLVINKHLCLYEFGLCLFWLF